MKALTLTHDAILSTPDGREVIVDSRPGLGTFLVTRAALADPGNVTSTPHNGFRLVRSNGEAEIDPFTLTDTGREEEEVEGQYDEVIAVDGVPLPS